MNATMLESLRNRISSANRAYRSGSPVMSDGEYDALLDQLRVEDPSGFEAFLDTLHDGSGGKVRHPYVLGSLNKLKVDEPEGILRFVESRVATALSVSAKVDGISCRLRYSGGRLESASSRGDGEFGEDLTSKIGLVAGVPASIPSGETVDVRGELVILKADFAEMEGFANPRNACAGIMNRKESSREWNESDVRRVTFVPYTILGPAYAKAEQFRLLEEWGFRVAWHVSVPKAEIDAGSIVGQLREWALQDLPYEIDGVVISDDGYVNEDKYRPDAQVAVKTNTLGAETVLVDVEWQGPSKDGRFCPIAVVEPVGLGGSTISKCTLNNVDYIGKLGASFGSRVWIEKRGDVIPAITKALDADPSFEPPRTLADLRERFAAPETCPSCGAELVLDGLNVRCANPECRDQKIYQVMHFIKKLGVMNASFKTLDNLGIDSYDRLLAFSPRPRSKSEAKLAGELAEKVFSRPPDVLFCALNIPGLGETLQRRIVDFYGWDEVSAPGFSPKGLPEGIGQATLDKFMERRPASLATVAKIAADGRYSGGEARAAAQAAGAPKGSVCFTGSLNTMTRNQASELAQRAGYEVKSSVGRGLTYLITNDPHSGSSKNQKAQKLGTKIITEEQFLALVDEKACDLSAL